MLVCTASLHRGRYSLAPHPKRHDYRQYFFWLRQQRSAHSSLRPSSIAIAAERGAQGGSGGVKGRFGPRRGSCRRGPNRFIVTLDAAAPCATLPVRWRWTTGAPLRFEF